MNEQVTIQVPADVDVEVVKIQAAMEALAAQPVGEEATLPAPTPAQEAGA